MKKIRRFISLIDLKIKMFCLLVVLLAGVGAVLSAKWPLLLSNIYSSLENFTLKDGLFAILIFATIYLLAEMINHIRRLITDCMLLKQESSLRLRCLQKMLRMPVEYFENSLSGEINARMNQSVLGFSQLIKLACNDVIPAILTSITVIVTVICNAPLYLALIMLGYMLVSIIISYFQIRSQNGMRETIMHKKNQLDGKFCQSVQNIELVRGRNADAYEKERLTPFANSAEKTERTHHTVMSFFDIVKKFIQIMTFSGLLITCLYMVKNGELKPGMTVTIILLFQQLFGPVETVYRCMDEIASGITKAKVIVDLFEADEDMHYSGSVNIESHNTPIVALKNCNVYAPSGKDQKSIATIGELEVYPNEKVLLDGRTGSGKSSIVRAIVGYFPHHGTIKLNDTNVDDIHPSAIAEHILYIPQIPMFFSGTIRDNLKFGISQEVFDETLVAALKRGSLFEELRNRNPNINPLDIILDEGAKNLSAGQRQRLSLARVFVHRYKLLILDEVTANLDVATAGHVMDELEQYSQEINAGILYISHETEVKARCDRAIMIQRLVG